MEIGFSQLGRELNKFVADSQKKMRLASYKTLNRLAFESKKKIKEDYPKHFPDENGIKKNKGVANLVLYDRNIDKSIPNNPSIRVFAADAISFMEKQEFGGTISGGKMGSSAAVPFQQSLRKMRSGTKGMKEEFSVSHVMTAAKAAVGASLKGGGKRTGNKPPKPFFMETKSGHTMVAIRKGKKRNPIMPLYHFDKKRTFRPRWDFFKTIDGVVVSMTEKVWGEELKKVLDKK